MSFMSLPFLLPIISVRLQDAAKHENGSGDSANVEVMNGERVLGEYTSDEKNDHDCTRHSSVE
jgi:hypothetical protein